MKEYLLKDNRSGKDTPFTTKLKVDIIGEYITFDFKCKDSKCYSAGDTYNSELYNGDVVEAFISTDGSRRNYYEIEVAPNNSVFFKKIENIDGEVVSAVDMENFIDSRVEIVDNGYNVQIKVPLNKIGYTREKGILFNAYRIETEGGIIEKNLLAVNPTLESAFHRPKYFIKY